MTREAAVAPRATEKSTPLAPETGAGRSSGLRKAAVFILALDESVASDVLRCLPDRELEGLTAEIARLGVVDQETLSSVLREFHELIKAHGVLKEGGLDQAIRLLERTFSSERSRRLVQLLESHEARLPLAFLARAETEGLLLLLEGEHPQTVAVVLAHMTPSKAAELLERLDDERRRDLIRRIAELQGTHEEVLERLGDSLREHVTEAALVSGAESRGGVEAAASILRQVGRGGRSLLNDLRLDQPELVDDIYRRLFVFEDLARLDDRSVQRVLKEIDRRCLATALKTAPPAVTEKIFDNLSRKASELVKEELEVLGPVRLADVEIARQGIVGTVLELEEAGEIFIEGRGSREDRLVY